MQMSRVRQNFVPVFKIYRLTRELAMDCEMVGDIYNWDMLARVSIVNNELVCIYDKYVKPTRHVADYRTAISGIRPEDMENGESFETVQREVACIVAGRVLVGHSIEKDLNVLFLCHPLPMIRDTQRFEIFQATMKTKFPGLKKLAAHFLGIVIQKSEHSSVEDAMATMQLYLFYQHFWGYK